MMTAAEMVLPGQVPGSDMCVSMPAVTDARDINAMRESLTGVAWRIIGDREQAADIVQDVLCDHFTKPEKFTGASSLKTYLYRMTINRSIDCRRRKNRFALIMELLGRERRPAVENVFEMKDMIRHMLCDIASEYKVPFVLAEGDGMSYREIAAILDVSVNTVRSRIFRCREKLRKKLQSAGYPL